ncbi:hypothetical protein EB796_010971 [Bugula neritina]|uniref:Uncharacterized protein n=1 Tax=Bugula neritina TaxID=10212 RepID=A0A7J7JWC1_BUGNE|nr:hypothetical protein EB796_010971 [Bugula neritina]
MLKQSLSKFASQFLAALNHENGIRKGNKGASINGKGSSIDSRIIEYRKYFEQLAKLKKVLDLVKGEYEDSKNYEIIRRYTRLKGMIKRTVMYARLEVLPEVSHAIGVNSLVLMMTPGVRKPLISIPECPKSELSNRIHLLQKRISFIRAQIDQLEESYQSSKQYIFFQRYRLMKAMIKILLTNCIDLQNNN